MIVELFLERADIPDPPCEQNGKCRHYRKCSEEQLACEAFVYYVGGREGFLPQHERGQRKPKAKEPAKEWYDMCFIPAAVNSPHDAVSSDPVPKRRPLPSFAIVPGAPSELLHLMSLHGQAEYKREPMPRGIWAGWLIAGKMFPHAIMHALKVRGLAKIYRDSGGVPTRAEVAPAAGEKLSRLNDSATTVRCHRDE